jgi:hypothetical protein
MKRLILFLLAFGLGLAVAVPFVSRYHAARNARERESQSAAWEAEKAGLETALANANNRAGDRPVAIAPVPFNAAPKATARKPGAQEILEKLKAVRIVSGPGQRIAAREAIVLFHIRTHV